MSEVLAHTPAASWGMQMFGRLARGLAAGVFGQLLGLATRVVLVPLFLRAWGVDVYGDWLLLSAFVAYLALTDAGASVYIVNRLTQEFARADSQSARRVLQSGLVLFLALPSGVFLLFSALVVLIGPTRLIGAQHIDAFTGSLVLVLLAAQFVVSLPHGLLLGIYRAAELLPRGVMLANVVLGLQLVATAAGLWLGFGLVPIAALQVLPYLVVGLFALVDLRQRFPELGLPSLREAQWGTVRGFARPSLHFLSIQVSSALSVQGTALVAGILLGSVQLVLFSTLRTMVNAVRSLLALVGHTAWPEMTRLDAVDDRRRLHALFRILLRTTMAGALECMIVLHVLGERIYDLWLRQSVAFQQQYLDLLLVYTTQAVFWTACSQLLMAVNKHHTLSRTVLASSALSVGLAFAGAQIAGIAGIVVGLVAADVVLPLWVVPWLVSRYEPSFNLGFYVREGGVPFLLLALVLVLPFGWIAAIPGVALWWTFCLPPSALGRWRLAHQAVTRGFR